MKTCTAREWFDVLDHAGIPCEVADRDFVLSVFDDPELIEKGWVTSYEQALVGRMDVAGLLFDLDATPGRIQGPPIAVGQDTRTVLHNIGYDDDRVDKLIALGAVSIREQSAVITGDTFEERLESLADVIWSFYRQRKFVAYEQLTMNLLRDPTMDAATVRLVRRRQAKIGKHLTELATQVVDDETAAVLPPTALLQILRGVAIGLSLAEAVPGRERRVEPDATATERHVLLDALAALVHAKPERPTARHTVVAAPASRARATSRRDGTANFERIDDT
jgi:CoA-transferase family III